MLCLSMGVCSDVGLSLEIFLRLKMYYKYSSTFIFRKNLQTINTTNYVCLIAFAFQAHYMLGLALLQKKEYAKGVKELEKV